MRPMNIYSVKLAELTVDESVQVRTTISSEVVERYRAAIEAGRSLPPVVVYRDDGGRLVVSDGFHRVEAAKLAHSDAIECEIRDGDIHKARWYATTANSKHGLPLNDCDKKRAILMAWAEWPKARGCRPSQRELAEHVGCSQPRVAQVLAGDKPLSESSSSSMSKLETLHARIDSALAENPNRSNREVAEEVGCNQQTVSRRRDEIGAHRTDDRNARKASQKAALERKLRAGTGDTVAALAEEFDLSTKTVCEVRKKLKSEQGETRPKRKHPADGVEVINKTKGPKTEIVPLDAFIRSTIAAIEARPVDEHRTVISAITNHFDHKEQKKLAAVDLQPVVH